MSASNFEKHCGRGSSKNWKQSFRVERELVERLMSSTGGNVIRARGQTLAADIDPERILHGGTGGGDFRGSADKSDREANGGQGGGRVGVLMPDKAGDPAGVPDTVLCGHQPMPAFTKDTCVHPATEPQDCSNDASAAAAEAADPGAAVADPIKVRKLAEATDRRERKRKRARIMKVFPDCGRPIADGTCLRSSRQQRATREGPILERQTRALKRSVASPCA